MTFSERNKLGFKMGLKRGIEFFFGVGSVATYVSHSLSSMGGKSSSGSSGAGWLALSPCACSALAAAKYRCKQEGRELKPRDLFKLKGLYVRRHRQRLLQGRARGALGRAAHGAFRGDRALLHRDRDLDEGRHVLFSPTPAFMNSSRKTRWRKASTIPLMSPRTYLMDEVRPGEKYELVISVLKGGAFMRYRVGDVYRCMGLENSGTGPESLASPISTAFPPSSISLPSPGFQRRPSSPSSPCRD